jgi:uncharacterized protein YjiS (DUF1127 family)
VATITHGSTTHEQLAHGHGGDVADAAKGPSLFARLVAFLQERRARAETMAALNRLDDRDLRDLHIHPCDFKAIAAGTYKNEN